MICLGPKTKNNDLTDVEELQAIEAFQEAEEYLDTGFVVEDYYYEPQD